MFSIVELDALGLSILKDRNREYENVVGRQAKVRL